MAYTARNISSNYAILLKQQVPPNGTIDLRETFVGFCKPKKSSKAEEAKYSEFKEDQFPEFLNWVEEMADRRVWILEYEDAPSRTRPTPAPSVKRKTIRRQQVMSAKESQRKGSSSEMTPKQIALLPSNEATKKLVADCSDIRKLKTALKLVKNLAGQERTRAILEDRVNELATEGIV